MLQPKIKDLEGYLFRDASCDDNESGDDVGSCGLNL